MAEWLECAYAINYKKALRNWSIIKLGTICSETVRDTSLSCFLFLGTNKILLLGFEWRFFTQLM